MCGRISNRGGLPWCSRPTRAPPRSAYARRVPLTGKLLDERETGIIPFAEVTWARPKLKNGMGGSPRVMTDVIKPGDVIYVSPREPTDKEPDVTGQWSLEQVPADQRCDRGHGSAHRPRVQALVGAPQLARKPVPTAPCQGAVAQAR